jgi:signal peptidase I
VSGSVQLVTLLGAGKIGALARRHLGGRAAWSLRLARIGTVSVLAGIGLGLFGAMVVPSLLGGRALTVLSGSMEPAVGVGDIVINSSVSPADVRVGDIVTFPDPEQSSRLITHRVRQVRIADGVAHFVTKGDNTNAIERWDLPARGSIGRVEYRIPLLGFLVFWLHGPFARIALIVLPALLLAGFELRRIWRRHPESAGDAKA